jgi:catechol 2,3-dioxygenase-like lactoylglutathione lyase family enzyme
LIPKLDEEGRVSIVIQSVMHVNVNCSNLQTSLEFYQEVVGLVPESHTHPVPQEGKGFGMPGQVQWDAHILHDARGYGGPGIDLLEWKQPAPVGRPSDAPNHLGFHRIGICVPDLEEVIGRARARNAMPRSAPGALFVDHECGRSSRSFWCRDPDGASVEFVESPGSSGVSLAQVSLSCRDVARSVEWYERVMGMEARGGRLPGPDAPRALGLPEDLGWDARLLTLPGRDGFAIDLVQWQRPEPVGAPPAQANHLGLYRMAFMVEDIREAHAELLAQGVACPEPVFLDMGPEIPVDGVWALFFPEPDGACLELIETPKIVGVTA